MSKLRVRPVDDDVETVRCPGCGKQRHATPGVYVCGDCGTEFQVERVEE